MFVFYTWLCRHDVSHVVSVWSRDHGHMVRWDGVIVSHVKWNVVTSFHDVVRYFRYFSDSKTTISHVIGDLKCRK